MDLTKWRIKKVGQVWKLFPPGHRVVPIEAGSFAYCVACFRFMFLEED